MAKPDTPNKKFGDSVSNLYYGSESSRKQVSCILYSGPYFNIDATGDKPIGQRFSNEINSALKTGEIPHTTGELIQGKRKYYLMIDRNISSKYITSISRLNELRDKNFAVYEAGVLSFFKDKIRDEDYESIMRSYSDNLTKELSKTQLLDMFQGMWAAKNCYIILDEVLGLVKTGVSYMRDVTYIFQFGMARSAVPGSFDHAELIGVKYLGNDLRATSSVVVGLNEELNEMLGEDWNSSSLLRKLNRAGQIINSEKKDRIVKHTKK